MAISEVGKLLATAATYTDGITFDLTSIGTLLKDDIVIISIDIGSSGLPTTPGIVTSGYTTLADLYSNDGNDTNLLVAYKRMGASPDTSVVTTASGASGKGQAAAVRVLRGVDATTALDVAVQSVTSGNSVIPTPPPITPASSGALIMCIGGGAHQRGDTEVYTTGDLTSFHSVSSNETRVAIIGTGTNAWTGGTYTPSAFGFTAGDSGTYSAAAVTLAFRPEVEGAGSGSAYGTSTVSGVGSSTADSAASISGAASVSTVGASTADAVASSSGTSTVAGVGSSTVDSAASISGAATVAAVGASTADAVASISGAATVAAVGASTADAAGTVGGASEASGVGSSAADASATISGTSTVAAVGRSGSSGRRSAYPATSANAGTPAQSLSGGVFPARNGGIIAASLNGGTYPARNGGTVTEAA